MNSAWPNVSSSSALTSRTSTRNAHANLQQNQLLAALPEEEILRWQSNLEPVDLARGQVLHECAGITKHIYFPTTAIVSLMCNTAEGGSCEIAMVGHDGAVGISVFMGE